MTDTVLFAFASWVVAVSGLFAFVDVMATSNQRLTISGYVFGSKNINTNDFEINIILSLISVFLSDGRLRSSRIFFYSTVTTSISVFIIQFFSGAIVENYFKLNVITWYNIINESGALLSVWLTPTLTLLPIAFIFDYISLRITAFMFLASRDSAPYMVRILIDVFLTFIFYLIFLAIFLFIYYNVFSEANLQNYST